MHKISDYCAKSSGRGEPRPVGAGFKPAPTIAIAGGPGPPCRVHPTHQTKYRGPAGAPDFSKLLNEMTAIPGRTKEIGPASRSWLAVVRGKFPAAILLILKYNNCGMIAQDLSWLRFSWTQNYPEAALFCKYVRRYSIGLKKPSFFRRQSSLSVTTKAATAARTSSRLLNMRP